MKALLFVLLLCLASPAAARIDSASFAALEFRQHPGAQLPLDAQLTDEAGSSTTLAGALGGRPAILLLEYLRCRTLCSLVLSGAVASLQQAKITPGSEVSLIAISIDPRDTTADAASARARHAAQFSDPAAAASGMHFLTGSREAVARIAAAVGFEYRYDRQSDQFAHPAGFVVVTPTGRISRYMLGLNPSPAAIRDAVTEARGGVVEPAAHPLLLLCFGYDPDEGTAAALAMRLVRWVSFGAILGCALLVAFLSRRRRTA